MKYLETIWALLISVSMIQAEPMLPKMPVVSNNYYFAATAIDGSLESDFSNEAILIVTNFSTRTAVLAWDASASATTNPLITYKVYHGRQTRVYTNSVNVGTNLTATIRIVPPVLTNRVITVTSQNATNLQWCSKLGQSWTLLGATNWTATNPPSRMWRAMGRRTTPGKVFVTIKWQ